MASATAHAMRESIWLLRSSELPLVGIADADNLGTDLGERFQEYLTAPATQPIDARVGLRRCRSTGDGNGRTAVRSAKRPPILTTTARPEVDRICPLANCGRGCALPP
jgi:hypothetical protein